MCKQKYIYKLVDKAEIGFANRGLISLSRPIFEFRGSEGKIISFAQRIYGRYLKQGLSVKPSKTDLDEIKEWNKVYEETYGRGFRNEDINSESMILFCGIIQSYCGYFTTINLWNKRLLKKYLKRSNLSEKIGVIKLDLSLFDNNHWHADGLDSNFVSFVGDVNILSGYNGFSHLLNITYTRHFDNYHYLLKKYNKDDLRNALHWFDNVDYSFRWQKEKRIVFSLRSLEKNSSRIGCTNVYNFKKVYGSFEELVFRNIVDSIDYCSKSPRFVYLNVGDKVSYKSFDEILNKKSSR